MEGMKSRVGGNASKRVALVIAATASFITTFMGSSINVALPAIGEEFALDAVSLGWVSTSYLLAAAIFLVPFGRIADIYGRKRVLKYGVIIYTVASFLSAVSASAVALISFRVLQGIGGAMVYCTGIAILSSVFPPGERGKALGISVAATYTGLWAICGWIANAASWLEEHIFCKCAFRFSSYRCCFMEAKGGMG